MGTRRSVFWRAVGELSWLVFGGLPDLSVVRDLFAWTLSQRPSIAFRLLAVGCVLLRPVRGGKHHHRSPQACAGGGFRSHGHALECEFYHRSLRTGFDFCDGRVHCHRVGEALSPNQGSGVGGQSTALTLPSAKGLVTSTCAPRRE